MSEDLLRRLRESEPAARTELFEYCNTRLRPFLLRKLPNPADVDDCVSEVVIRALEGIERGPQPRVLNAWLVGIAKNLLKERYTAKSLAGGELPEDLPAAPADPPLELDRPDLPEQPSDYEMWVGKRQLWDTLFAATSSLSESLAAIMRTHMELTLRRKHLVVGTELAEALGQPVEIVNRQLNRSKSRMLDALVPLVLARTGSASCPALAGLLDEILSPEQRRAGRRLRLDPTQASTILGHANACAACAPQVDEARDFSRWALGPGLLNLANDDEERRRAIIAMLDRAGDGSLASQSPTAAAVTAIPAPLVAEARSPAGIIERVRSAISTKAAMLPRPDAVVQLAQENPDAFHRIVTAVASGVVVVAAIVVTMLATDHPERHETLPPPPVPTTSTVAPAGTPPTSTPAQANPPTTTTTTAVPVVAQGPRQQVVATTTTTPPAPPTTTTTSAPTTTTTTTTTSPSTTTTTTTSQPPPVDAVTIDLTDLDYTWFMVSGVNGWQDATRAQHYKLTPGPHTLKTSANQTLTFRVTDDNRIDYDQSQEGTLTGKGSNTLAAHGKPVSVNATDLDYYNATVVGIQWRTPQTIRTYKLLPGNHAVLTPVNITVPFTVSGNGQVGYDPAWAGVLTGTGSGTLAVHGFPITVDVTDLDYANTTVNGIGWQPLQRVRVRKLLPGKHLIVTTAGINVPFAITDTGRVSYEAGWQGILTGDGSTTIAVHGFPITLDTSDLDYVDVEILGGIGPYKPVHTVKVLPGPHAVVVAYLGNPVPFTVSRTGQLSYAADLEGLVTGFGGSTLTAHGLRVALDISDLSYDNVTVTATGWPPRQAVRIRRLLPGPHRVYNSAGTSMPFRVTRAGTVEYDDTTGLLTGAGSTTLALHGFPITLDVSSLGYSNTVVSWTGWPASQPVRTYRLWAGPHLVITSSGIQIPFTVTGTGRVTYDPGREGVLTGSGGTTLVVHGFPVTINVEDLDYAIATPYGVPTGPRLRTIGLLPGPHRITINGPTTPLPFTISDTGKVQYDGAFEGRFTGAGTATLAVHGFPITLDATELDYSGVGVGGTFEVKDRVHVFRLLPGAHYLVVSNRASYSFTITGTGTVQYNANFEGPLTGSGGTTLTVHGFHVTLDATELDYSGVGIGGTFQTPDRVHVFRLLPGAHYLVVSNRASYPFTITDTGKVQYDPKYEGVYSGNGGATLAVHGFRVTLDAAEIDYLRVGIGGTYQSWERSHVFRLLPGPHYLVVNSRGSEPFAITDAGKVQYDPKYEGLYTGSGGTTLAVHGFRVALDVTDLDYANVTVGGIAWGVPRPPRTYRLVPGAHYVDAGNALHLPFSVSPEGKVLYDAKYEGVFTGAGGTILAVHGFQITIDATESGYTSIAVSGVGLLDARRPRTLRLLPGAHSITTVPSGGLYRFTVTDAGKVDYDPSFDAVLSGRGTATLTVRRPRG